MNRLSIIICTYNRSITVLKLIDFFDNTVEVPENMNFEILIVDNNSYDKTKESVSIALRKEREYCLRYTLEKESGLSNARNRGIREAKYNNILFLDDDIIPSSNFLIVLNHALIKNKNIQCYAIRVLYNPILMPPWYRLDGRYRMLNRGGYNLGNESRLLTDKDPLPIGAGMVISKQIFDEVGFFDPKFGYDQKKSMYIPGEETELFLKIKSHNYQIYYIHDAIINHYPETEKFDLDTLCKTYMGIGYWYGSADARKLKEGKVSTWAGYPRAYYKRFFLFLFPYLISRLTPNKTIRYYYLFKMKEAIGLFKGYRDFRKT